MTRAAALVSVLFLAGCATTSRIPDAAHAPAHFTGSRLVRIAADFIGTPYRYGGEDPHGFDCSGLVFYSFARLGVAVPRTAAAQKRAARPVKRSALRPGDLVFFRSRARRVDHVGIYAGRGRFIHAPASGGVVSYAYLDDPWYRKHFAGAGRF